MGFGTQERIKGILRVMAKGNPRTIVVPEALRATRTD